MTLVEVEEGCGAFAGMLGGLLQANLQADPGKAALVRRTTGSVGMVVSDTGEEVRLLFTGALLRVTSGPAMATDLRLVGTADVIMGLSTVPLRLGLPDPMSSSGRALTGRWATGGLQIHGLPRSAPLLRTLLSLLSVLA
ncbi:MAG TPA: hypothetical protein VMM13_17440 [Euzebya sp.]|nr:hypothetical protein [Euzebya sp.]